MLIRLATRLVALVAIIWFVFRGSPAYPYSVTDEVVMTSIPFGIPAIIFTAIEHRSEENGILTVAFGTAPLILLFVLMGVAGSSEGAFASRLLIGSIAWAGVWILTRYNIGYVTPADEQ